MTTIASADLTFEQKKLVLQLAGAQRFKSASTRRKDEAYIAFKNDPSKENRLNYIEAQFDYDDAIERLDALLVDIDLFVGREIAWELIYGA